jgi:hypothetical protein
MGIVSNARISISPYSDEQPAYVIAQNKPRDFDEITLSKPLINS